MRRPARVSQSRPISPPSSISKPPSIDQGSYGSLEIPQLKADLLKWRQNSLYLQRAESSSAESFERVSLQTSMAVTSSQWKSSLAINTEGKSRC